LIERGRTINDKQGLYGIQLIQMKTTFCINH